ncbi:hypothetical protein, partial [Flavobacterium sp.]|uniref:hypothetical protein n=1 Tax=Flavobacterium sp. TaxID=239 RepID=UPI002FDB42BA
TATPTNGGTAPTYQWKINGTNVTGETASTFTTTTLSNNDIVTVVMTSNANCVTGSLTTTSNSITETVNSYLPASVSITASDTIICAGSNVTFTATPTNGGTTPTYQWRVNGTNIPGETAAAFTTNTLSNNDVVTVVMTSNLTCVTSSPATSNSITEIVNANLMASVTIAASATDICAGSSVTFTATPTNGGTAPTYQWKINDTNVSGETAATFTTTTLSNDDTVTLVMTSNITCVSGSPATSNGITVTVNAVSIGGDVTGGTGICSGTTSGLLTLAGHTGAVVRWESSISPFTSWTSIANTATTYTSGALTQTTKYRAVVQSGVCGEVYSTSTTVDIKTTTWKITSPATTPAWDNGDPDDGVKAAVIETTYPYPSGSGADINACSLTVANGVTVAISSGYSVTLSGALSATGAFVTFNNNANLIQTGNTNSNVGAIIIKRDSSLLKRLDYTLWSTPVTGPQTLFDF